MNPSFLVVHQNHCSGLSSEVWPVSRCSKTWSHLSFLYDCSLHICQTSPRQDDTIDYRLTILSVYRAPTCAANLKRQTLKVLLYHLKPFQSVETALTGLRRCGDGSQRVCCSSHPQEVGVCQSESCRLNPWGQMCNWGDGWRLHILLSVNCLQSKLKSLCKGYLPGSGNSFGVLSLLGRNPERDSSYTSPCLRFFSLFFFCNLPGTCQSSSRLAWLWLYLIWETWQCSSFCSPSAVTCEWNIKSNQWVDRRRGKGLLKKFLLSISMEMKLQSRNPSADQVKCDCIPAVMTSLLIFCSGGWLMDFGPQLLPSF